jgi:hypothetical protein
MVAIERIVSANHRRGAAFNRQHPFMDVLFSVIAESGKALDLAQDMRQTVALSSQPARLREETGTLSAVLERQYGAYGRLWRAFATSLRRRCRYRRWVSQ